MKFEISDTTINISKNLQAINLILSPFYEKGHELSVDMYREVKDLNDVDVFLNKIYERSHEYINVAVQMAIDILIKLDIWDYNVDRFNDEYQEDYYDVDKALAEHYAEKYAEIMDEESDIAFTRNAERSSRAGWSGGGFGLSGAIKGAVQAELLNIATDAIRSAKDEVEDKNDRASIKKMKDELLNDRETFNEYLESFRMSVYNVGWALYSFLIARGDLPKYNFNFETAYARYENIVSSTLPDNEKVSKLTECILMYPYFYDFYDALYDIYPDKSVFDLAVYFGFKNGIKNKFLEDFLDDFQTVSEMPFKTPVQIDEKFQLCEKLLIKYKFMNSKKKWDNKFAESYHLLDFQQELIETYDNLELNRRVFNKKEYASVEEAQEQYDSYVENRQKAREQEENIETAKGCLKGVVSIVAIGGIIYFLYYVLSKSGILSALIKMLFS